MILLDRKYGPEEIVDIEEDIFHLISELDEELDPDGFHTGSFRIILEYIKD